MSEDISVQGRWSGLLVAAVVFVALSFYLHTRSENIADLDGLYHFRHSALYASRGLTDSSFPWTEFSVVKKEGADPWYGFHLLLIPFTYFSDSVIGLKAASIFVTALSAFLIFLAFRRLGTRWPVFWVIALFFSSPDFLFRFTALRPQLISFGLILLLFSYILSKVDVKKIPYLCLFFVSLAIAWVHLAFAWMLFFPLLAIGFFARTQRQRIGFAPFLYMVAGTVAAILLHPNILGTLKLTYVQVVRLLWEKQAGTPLLFGTEMLRFTSQNFWDQFVPITLLLAVALYFWIKLSGGRHPDTIQRLPGLKIALFSSAFLASVFFYLSFSSARRSADFFFGFALIFVGLVFSRVADRIRLRELFSGRKLLVSLLFFALVGVMAGVSFVRYQDAVQKSYDPRAAQEVGEWLIENSKSGDIVFHPLWDQFAQLFFWNTQNRYINGMDPIFEYVYDPSLYWKHHFFSTDWAGEFTCPAQRCTADMLEDSYKALKDDFRADFVYLQKNRNPRLFGYLAGDARYKKVFENEKEAIFSL
ncbi:MAG: hypothetical protein HYW91_00925 [Candidatus Sungbacteria bacterium]|nr:hypothetical protein [Candidatus Sungbacteria bacterium]